MLPFSSKASHAVWNNLPWFETLRKGAYEADLRLLTFIIHSPDRQPYLLQLGVTMFDDEDAPFDVDYQLASRPHIFFMVVPVLLIIITFLGYVFMKKAFAPVHQIVTLAKQISAEDLSHRIDSVNSHDEIGELANTFNEMIARLERSFQQIKQFSGDVSHELKTPLTAIKGEIEVALRKERTPTEYTQILQSLLEDTNKLEKMIQDLLFLSRMDAHSIPLSFTPLALDELLLEVYEDTYRLAERK